MALLVVSNPVAFKVFGAASVDFSPRFVISGRRNLLVRVVPLGVHIAPAATQGFSFNS